MNRSTTFFISLALTLLVNHCAVGTLGALPVGGMQEMLLKHFDSSGKNIQARMVESRNGEKMREEETQ
jgi:hypothetical protein